jgi:hypothetical protein
MQAHWRAGLVACAILAATAARAGDGKPEKLLGLRVEDEKAQVTFDVWTTGCTRKADFRLERSAEGFTLVRVTRDTCKMMPMATQVTFTFAELGLKPHAVFTVGNRFAANPHAAAID